MAVQIVDPPNTQIVSQGFAGGVNIRDNISSLQADEAPIMENGVLDEKGVFGKRRGCMSMGTVGASGDRIISSYTFYRGTAGPPQVIVQTSAGTLYCTNDPTANPQVWTVIASGLSGTAPFSFETFRHKCYFSNGVDYYSSWDGTTYTTYPSAPKSKFLRLWKDTRWAAGVTGYDDRVYSSNAADAETWNVANWVDIAQGDGDQITALATDGNYLIVFKRRRHMVIFDPALFSNRIVDFEKGCESHFGVGQLEGNIYFFSRQGICQYYGDAPSRIISMKLDPFFDPRVVNLNALASVWCYTFGNDRIGWSIPEVGSSTPTVQLEYYPRLGALSPYLGTRMLGPFVFHRFPCQCTARWRYGTQDLLFTATPLANKLLQAFAAIGTDDGAAFTATLETGALSFGNPDPTKYLRRCRVVGRGQFQVQFKRNFSPAAAKTVPIDLTSSQDLWSIGHVWNTGAWGPDATLKEIMIHPDVYAKFFQIRFTDSSTQVGRKILPVGNVRYSLDAGEWGVYLLVLDGHVLGVRD